MFSVMTSSFTSISLYSVRWSVKSLSETFVRGAGARWFMCVWEEGRARLLGLGHDFFCPNLILRLIFPYFSI